MLLELILQLPWLGRTEQPRVLDPATTGVGSTVKNLVFPSGIATVADVKDDVTEGPRLGNTLLDCRSKDLPSLGHQFAAPTRSDSTRVLDEGSPNIWGDMTESFASIQILENIKCKRLPGHLLIMLSMYTFTLSLL